MAVSAAIELLPEYDASSRVRLDSAGSPLAIPRLTDMWLPPSPQRREALVQAGLDGNVGLRARHPAPTFFFGPSSLPLSGGSNVTSVSQG